MNKNKKLKDFKNELAELREALLEHGEKRNLSTAEMLSLNWAFLVEVNVLIGLSEQAFIDLCEDAITKFKELRKNRKERGRQNQNDP